MRAVIVAGGMGTRLLPQTEKVPKCLVKVAGRPILDYQLDILVNLGITDVAIVIGHFGDQIVGHAQVNYSDKINFSYFENTEYRDTQNAYSLWLARDFLKEDKEGFIILNSDLIFQQEMLSQLLSDGSPDGMIVDVCENMDNDMVKVKLSENKIVEMSKTLPSQETSTEAVGPVKFSKSGGEKFLNYLGQYFDDKDKKNWLFYMIGDFGKQHHFAAIYNNGYTWAEIDNTEDLRVAEEKCTNILS